MDPDPGSDCSESFCGFSMKMTFCECWDEGALRGQTLPPAGGPQKRADGLQQGRPGRDEKNRFNLDHLSYWRSAAWFQTTLQDMKHPFIAINLLLQVQKG